MAGVRKSTKYRDRGSKRSGLGETVGGAQITRKHTHHYQVPPKTVKSEDARAPKPPKGLQASRPPVTRSPKPPNSPKVSKPATAPCGLSLPRGRRVAPTTVLSRRKRTTAVR